MASGGSENASTLDYDECPVCRECLKDPRTLACGHYFCTKCLKGIVNENLEGSIKCPTCREVTRIAQVIDLPQHEGKYSLEEQITDFLVRAKRREVTRYCDRCGDQKVTATCYCYDCRKNLCQDCLDKHSQKTKLHKAVPIADSIFCETHPKEVVTMYCRECNGSICLECAFDEHDSHQTVDIKDVAKESIQRLEDFLGAQLDIDRDKHSLMRIQSHLETAKSLELVFKESVTKTRIILKELKAKLDQVERDTKAKLAAEIKTLVLYETDVKDLVVSKQSLIDHAKYLIEKASEPEIVEQEKGFPMAKVDRVQNVDSVSIELPEFNTTFTNICTQLKQMVVDCKVEFLKRNLKQTDIKELKRQRTVPVTHVISGITIDNQRHRLLTRTADTTAPLKVYDYTGNLLESLGAGVVGLANNQHRGICKDTKRTCYMAPCQNTLVLVNTAGQQIKSIAVGSDNRGVAYHDEDDCYLVSDITKHTVYLIDPNTSQITRQIGLGPTQLNRPYNIHVGTVAGIGRAVILVSCYNHCIKMFDVSGRPLKTYGSQGVGNGQLRNPWGVQTDSKGRVIVSDQINRRVVSYWTDCNDKDQWECVLSNQWEGNNPLTLALDKTGMVMVIIDSGLTTIHIYN